MSKPVKKLVLCVHGIGEQQAGQTLDSLTGSLVGNGRAKVESETRFLSDEFRPNLTKEEARFGELFPCHIRRINYAEENQEVVFAEVFWADLSRPRDGMIGAGIELIKGILGLGHLVRENAEKVCVNNWTCRKLSELFVFLMHSSIVVINLLMLFTALVSLSIYSIGLNMHQYATDIAVLLLGLLCMCFGLWKLRRGNSLNLGYLYRYFAVGLVIYSGLFVVVVLLTGFGIQPEIKSFICKIFILFTPIDTCSDYVRFDWYSKFLLSLLYWAWALNLIVLTAMLVLQFLSRKIGKQTITPAPLFSFVCATMALLWLSLSTAFWRIIRPFVTYGGNKPETTAAKSVSPDYVAGFDTHLNYSVALLLLIVIVCGYIWFWRKNWSKRHRGGCAPTPDEKSPETTSFSERNRSDDLRMRVLVNSKAQKIVVGGAILIAVLVAALIFGNISSGGNLLEGEDNSIKLLVVWGGYIDNGVALFVALCGFLFIYNRPIVLQALGVGKDVVTYFKGQPSKTDKLTDAAWSHPNRYRIHGRLKTVAKTMIASEQPEEIVIISHSLGTVAAVKTLVELYNDTGENPFENKNITSRTLITMGSPITHIFEYYFGDDFKVPDTLQQHFPEWINIFCINDFVGTFVGKENSDWPQNKSVNRSSHTKYWTDENTISIIKPYI